MNKQQLETFAIEMLPHYLECAQWADAPEEGVSFEFSEEAEHLAFIDCLYFVRNSFPWFRRDSLTPEQVGHNLWLSRNGHGTGFWDRGFVHGNFLHARAARMETCDLYLSGDDDVIYLEMN